MIEQRRIKSSSYDLSIILSTNMEYLKFAPLANDCNLITCRLCSSNPSLPRLSNTEMGGVDEVSFTLSVPKFKARDLISNLSGGFKFGRFSSMNGFGPIFSNLAFVGDIILFMNLESSLVLPESALVKFGKGALNNALFAATISLLSNCALFIKSFILGYLGSLLCKI